MIFKTGDIEEWFEYGGNPYHFKVTGLTEAVSDGSKLIQLINLIRLSKNLRSWCDFIEFECQINGTVFIGAAVVDDEEIIISSEFKDEFKFTKDISIGVAIMSDTEVDIKMLIA